MSAYEGKQASVAATASATLMNSSGMQASRFLGNIWVNVLVVLLGHRIPASSGNH